MGILLPFKCVYGLIGAPRSGKDEVANFLSETRNFQRMAFADQIKKEFGISVADFEKAKIAGNINELRQKLWEFSAEKKKLDPQYFIKKVINNIIVSKENCIVTDIRTTEEINSFLDIPFDCQTKLKKIYFVRKSVEDAENFNQDGFLIETKIHKKDLDLLNLTENSPSYINNMCSGLFEFYRFLEKFFFTEDICACSKISPVELTKYIQQFNITEKKNQ